MKDLLQHIIHQIDRVEDKISATDNKIDSIDKTMVMQERNLEEHMRRTELLEKQQEKFNEDLIEIKKSKTEIKAIAKFIVKASPILCAIGAAIYKYLM